jgi:hypothetical protein
MCEQLELLITEVRPVVKRKTVKKTRVRVSHPELLLKWGLTLGE